MSDPIQDAIARAQQSAGQAAAGPATVEGSTGTAVAAAPAGGALAVPGQMMSMQALMSAGLSVDAWLKVKEFGLLIGSESTLIQQPIKVKIDMTEGRGFVPKMTIKAGNPATYWSTTDGVTCDKGGTWADAVAKATAIDPKQRPYRAVDLPMIVMEDVKVGDKVLAKAGSTLGHTTATTNWKNFENFFREVANASLMGQPVIVNIGYEPMENKHGNKWGCLTFTLVGAAQ